ncbi:hypothetical protein C8R45DRAFT_1004667 [Mycena sanguinolenta]|nr:hypothetical protein C8R45DRAFT_1004667 [Mycena sanguinolenta]
MGLCCKSEHYSMGQSRRDVGGGKREEMPMPPHLPFPPRTTFLPVTVWYASRHSLKSRTTHHNTSQVQSVCGISPTTLSIADLSTVAGSVSMARVLVLVFSFVSGTVEPWLPDSALCGDSNRVNGGVCDLVQGFCASPVQEYVRAQHFALKFHECQDVCYYQL